MRAQHQLRSRARRAVAGFAVAALLAAATSTLSTPAEADTAPATGTPATVSADPLPTVQQNGVVWAQVTVGNVVYATGSFSETWPGGQSDKGTNETARADLLAYNLTTGHLVRAFEHSLNAQGLGIAASPDGKTVYVVGDFTTVDGKAHDHVAAFSTGTGAIDKNFHAGVSGEASAVTASASAVYVGGDFTAAGSVTRTRLAAFAPSTGALLSWAPTADDGQVSALALTPNGKRVIVGGRFTTINGQAASGMGSVDATSGAGEPWAINTLVQDGSSSGKCGITDLSVDANAIYGGGFAYGCGNFEGTFAADPTTGAVVWINDCHGDTYSTQPDGKVLYVASHSHDCTAIGQFPDASPEGGAQRATAYTTAATGGTDTGPDNYGYDYSGQPDGTLLDWFPTLAIGTVTNQHQAAWSVTGNSKYIAYGGEFPTVNDTAQQGLVRFATRTSAPNTVGPIAASTLTPSASSTRYGEVDLSWTATWDRDNAKLTYTILRDGIAVATVNRTSNFWQLPTLSYADEGLTPGSSHTYRIRVTDPFGNLVGSAASSAVSVSDAGGPPADPPVLAADKYNRTVASGWGAPKTGGVWSHAGCSALSVAHGYGSLVGANGTTCSAWLPAIDQSSTNTTVTVRAPSVPNHGLQVAVVGRRISSTDDVRLRLDLEHDGSVQATLLGHAGATSTALSKTVTVPAPAKADGRVHIELQVVGTSPTTVRARVWQNGTSEPSGWTVRGTTSAAALQHAGSVGVTSYLYHANARATTTLRVLSLRSTQVAG